MEQTDFRTHYNVLELPFDADETLLRRQYRRLAQRYHPDSEAGDTDKFVAVRQAYDALQAYMKRHGHLPLAFTMPTTPVPVGGIRRHAGTRRMQRLYGSWAKRRRWLVGASMIAALVYIAWPRDPEAPSLHPVVEGRRAGMAVDQATFGDGSTMSEVLDAQGVPDSGSETVWRYGKSTVHFHNGRVMGWNEHPAHPLNLKR